MKHGRLHGKRNSLGTTWAMNDCHKKKTRQVRGSWPCHTPLVAKVSYHHPLIVPKSWVLICIGHIYHCHLSWANSEDRLWRRDGFAPLYPQSGGYCSCLSLICIVFQCCRGSFHYNPIVKIMCFGNYIQYFVKTHKGKESERICMYIIYIYIYFSQIEIYLNHFTVYLN